LFEGDFSEIFSALPFIFGLPIPNLSNASLTSPGAPGTRFFGFVVETALLTPPLRTLKGLWAGPRFAEVGGSKVFTDAGRGATRAGFDMLLRPSSAPRRSATPTPRLNFPRLWRERLSMFIKVGVTRSREWFRKASGLACTSKESLRADSAVHFLDNLAWSPGESNPVTSWTFDEATSATSHSAELMPLQGAHSTPSSNSCAVCGGCKTPGFEVIRVKRFDGERKPPRA